MKSTCREEAVYAAVRMGWFEIRNGEIWRVRQRRKDRWSGAVKIVPVAPHRVDAPVGAGYRTVKVMVDGKQVCCLAHRLVWLHLNGPIPPAMQVNHKNGVKSDNYPDNLELVTASGNMKHAYRIGLKEQYGQRNPAAKLNDLDVNAIRTAYATGRMTQAALAMDYMVKHQTISRIARGDSRPRQDGPTADYVANRQRGARGRDSLGRFHS